MIREAGRRTGVIIVGPDQDIVSRAEQALSQERQFSVATHGNVLSAVQEQLVSATSELLVVELVPPFFDDLAALEIIMRAHGQAAPSVVVIADDVGAAVSRSLLKLNIADWLPRSFSEDELVMAAHHALASSDGSAGDLSRTLSVAFMPVIGGAGATTLSISALEILCRQRKLPKSACCIVDMNLQSGTVADYLNVATNLKLDEITGAPERLDGQLLEILLSKQAGGYMALCAEPSLDRVGRVSQEIVGRLLDLCAVKFKLLVIDMPRIWWPWCDSIVRGTDKFYFVTDMSVAGLNHVVQMAALIGERLEMDMSGSVIVNKSSWLGVAGVTKKHVEDVLGDYFAGYVPDCFKEVRTAQNQGLLLSDVRSKSALETGLQKVLQAT